MSAPQPLEGTNPYTGLYQIRQFGVGDPFTQTPPNSIFQDLANPPAAALTAEAQTPLVEEQENQANPQPGIIPD